VWGEFVGYSIIAIILVIALVTHLLLTQHRDAARAREFADSLLAEMQRGDAEAKQLAEERERKREEVKKETEEALAHPPATKSEAAAEIVRSKLERERIEKDLEERRSKR
jgi:biopolymer transport protein ExbB/TolQ